MAPSPQATDSAAAATAATTRPRSALVVFDYDFSLVNEDCDVFVLQQLCPELLAEVTATLTGPPPNWPGLVDTTLGELAKRMPHVTRDEMQRVVAAIPVLPRMLDAVRLAAQHGNADVKIVSDANTVFIQSMLEYHALAPHDVSEVISNPAAFEPDSHRLRVQPYHPLHAEPHGCEFCPTNMCKGRILDELRRRAQYDLVLYVGDGPGDFCPSTRLSSRDIVFARANGADGKSFGLLEKIRGNADLVRARVVEWSSGEEIYEHFRTALAVAA